MKASRPECHVLPKDTESRPEGLSQKRSRPRLFAKKQSAYLKKLKEEVKEGECIAIGDFSQNFKPYYQLAAQGLHWSDKHYGGPMDLTYHFYLLNREFQMPEHQLPNGFSKFHRELFFRTWQIWSFYLKMVYFCHLLEHTTPVLASLPKKCGMVSCMMVPNRIAKFRVL